MNDEVPKSQKIDLENLVKKVIKLLEENFPNPKTELNYENEMQLSIAVALSAQTTDTKVNEITKELFNKYKTWEDFAEADLKELKEDIYGVNYYNGKADRLIKMAQTVRGDFSSKLPRNIKDLTKLSGIARKSANVIMQVLWGKAEGIVVDTHVSRVSKRLGLTGEDSPVKIEKDLMDVVPKEKWGFFSGAMVLHGRYVCTARNPNCKKCNLSSICSSAHSFD